MSRSDNRKSVNYDSHRIRTPQNSASTVNLLSPPQPSGRVSSDGVMYSREQQPTSTIRIVSEPDTYHKSASSASISKRLSQVPSFLLPYPHSDFFNFSPPPQQEQEQQAIQSQKVQQPPQNLFLQKPSNLKVNTGASDPTSFSFSEHNDSIQDFQVSPTKDEFDEPNIIPIDSPVKSNDLSSQRGRNNYSGAALPFVDVPEFSLILKKFLHLQLNQRILA